MDASSWVSSLPLVSSLVGLGVMKKLDIVSLLGHHTQTLDGTGFSL